MGIPGLMTYINQHSDVYLKNYNLHDTCLVIDGNSLASQLYTYEAKCNCCFGGDYDKYAYSVSNFFNDLLKCNITPLILIDGGSEDKKLNTLYKRTKERINTAYNLIPYKQSRTQLFPLFLKEVFKDVVHEKGIKCAQSLFEADDDIASVAKILNCPVLSFDSDFYIFDVIYIPYNTLNYGITKKPCGNGYMKTCKVYKIDYFLQRFPGMDKSLMPLAATLLGNDYINKSTFKNFFFTLKLTKASKRRYNELQRRIEAVFRWLQNQTLDSGIAKVLSKLDSNKREKVLEVMEMIINGYLIASAKMMIPLGFSMESINSFIQKFPNNPYKFQHDINNLNVPDSPKNEDESDLSCNEDSNSLSDELEIVTPKNESNFIKKVPEWFIEDFHAAKFPSYFIDMLTRQIYSCPVQVEDFSRPTTINISLKIIRVIFKLLNTGTTNIDTLEYIARGKLTSIITCKLKCDDHILNCKFPSLFNLHDLPHLIRKEIMDETLQISNELINCYPPSWRLYIGTIKYWIDEADEPFRTNCHLYALLFIMLYHVIDEQIGFHRSQSYFHKHYNQKIQMLQLSRNIAMVHPDQNMSIEEALHRVNVDDCLLACPFFLTNFVMDQALMRNPKKYNVSTVHAFSLFQNCLRHSIHLNALLGYPYQPPCIAKFFNGTLLYNVYNNFKSRHDINYYISIVLRNSPSLLQLFISIVAPFKTLLCKTLENKTNNRKRKKNKNRQTHNPNSLKDELDDDDGNDDSVVQESVSYNDVNNRYSVLSEPHM
ncbi:protein asteroid-like [Phymastichus coffea]|uniref:protein asteroid-like n=1 Tax=Phymastichus coffea TaxID=108790 RepID=UPI00273A7DDE|nr:protein asteroid-like [Phymastichus coffea]